LALENPCSSICATVGPCQKLSTASSSSLVTPVWCHHRNIARGAAVVHDAATHGPSTELHVSLEDARRRNMLAGMAWLAGV
jgi:hypothetical protein